MTPVEALFDYLITIREAKKYISTKRGERLSAEDIIALTALARHLYELEPYNVDILANVVELNCTSDKALAKTKNKILSECGSFIELYLGKQECFDDQCSYNSIFQLINSKVDSEFHFSKEAADKEVVKWNNIFRKYNDITRLYNSMDCRPGQEAGDMQIIKGYMDELYDMIGHPINLENINEEHDGAYETLRQKEKEKEEIADKKRKRFYELSEMIDTDVLYSISSYAESLVRALSSEDENPVQDTADIPTSVLEMAVTEQVPSVPTIKQKRGRGRPSKKERYAKAEITDFKSCFTNENYYDLVVSEIKKEATNSIDGVISHCIIDCLFKSGYLKSEVRSTGDLANFMINEFPTQFHISSGTSSYDDYGIEAEIVQDWKRRLSKGNI